MLSGSWKYNDIIILKKSQNITNVFPYYHENNIHFGKFGLLLDSELIQMNDYVVFGQKIFGK